MVAPDAPDPMSTCRCDPAYAGIASQFSVPAIDLDQTMMLRITATFRKRADWRDMRMDVPWEAKDTYLAVGRTQRLAVRFVRQRLSG